MTAPVLKKTLGEAGAFFADDHGDSNLYDVLKAICKQGQTLTALQATIATGVLKSYVATQGGVIGDISLQVGTTGTSGATSVVVNKNGTPLTLAPASVDNTAADGTAVSADLSSDPEAAFVAGDVIDIEVTAAPGTSSGANLDVTLHLRPASIQA